MVFRQRQQGYIPIISYPMTDNWNTGNGIIKSGVIQKRCDGYKWHGSEMKGYTCLETYLCDLQCNCITHSLQIFNSSFAYQPAVTQGQVSLIRNYLNILNFRHSNIKRVLGKMSWITKKKCILSSLGKIDAAMQCFMNTMINIVFYLKMLSLCIYYRLAALKCWGNILIFASSLTIEVLGLQMYTTASGFFFFFF